MSALRTIPTPTAPSGHHFDGFIPSDSDGPCTVCGRIIRKARYWVHEIDGGGTLLHRDDEDAYQSDGGDLGLQPVGSECVRRVPPEYRHR
jgi:hypothetical protein